MRKLFTSSFGLFLSFLVLLALLTSCGSKRTKELPIGCISPFSGDGAVYGEELKRGFEIFLSDLRSHDSLLYSRVKVIYEDDNLDSKTAVNALNKLIDVHKVQVVIGAFTSNTTLAIAPIAERKQVVLLTPTATNFRLKDAGDYIFRVTPSDAYQGKILADFVLDSLQKSTACVLFLNTDYGVGLRNVFQESFEARGGQILSSDGFEMSATDMRAQLQKVKELHPDILYLPSNYIEAVHVVRQAKELGVRAQIVCTDGVFEQDFLRLTGEAAEGIYISTMAWGTGRYSEQADRFRKQYRERYNQEPGVYSALCHDALAVVVEVLKRTEYSSAAIKNELYQIELVGATGLNKFDEFGEVGKDFDIYVVKDGRFARLGD